MIVVGSDVRCCGSVQTNSVQFELRFAYNEGTPVIRNKRSINCAETEVSAVQNFQILSYVHSPAFQWVPGALKTHSKIFKF